MNKDEKLEVFNDGYLKNLCYETIAELLEEVKEYTIKQFCDNCEDVVSTEYNCHCEYCEYQKYFDIIQKVKQVKN